MFRNCWVVMLTAALPATSAFSHLKTLISANEMLTDEVLALCTGHREAVKARPLFLFFFFSPAQAEQRKTARCGWQLTCVQHFIKVDSGLVLGPRWLKSHL